MPTLPWTGTLHDFAALFLGSRADQLPTIPWTGTLNDFIALWVSNGTVDHPNAGFFIGNGYSYGTVPGDCAVTCNGGATTAGPSAIAPTVTIATPGASSGPTETLTTPP